MAPGRCSSVGSGKSLNRALHLIGCTIWSPVPTKVNAMERAARLPPRVFFELKLAGRCFRGVIGADGPAIVEHVQPWWADGGGGVALGPSLIATADDRGWRSNGSLAVCKYSGREPRIDLKGLSASEITTLSKAFGLPVRDGAGHCGDCLFYKSDAFAALQAWVVQHPRLAKKESDRMLYLGDWYGYALDPGRIPEQKLRLANAMASW